MKNCTILSLKSYLDQFMTKRFNNNANSCTLFGFKIKMHGIPN